MRDKIYDTTKDAAMQTRLEPLHIISDNGSRPADIFFPSWMSTAKPAALDVSVVVPTRHNSSISAEDNYIRFLTEAYDKKCKTHEENCRNAGMNFIPMIFSTAGSVHPSSLKALNYIADSRSQRLNIPVHRGRADILQRISVAIHEGNARCILHHGFYGFTDFSIPRG